MNKSTIIWVYLHFFLSTLLFSQRLNIDDNLVGEWSGTEYGIQFDSLAKHWIQIRYKNGKSKTIFKMFVDGEPFEATEYGKWWILNGKFCEQENSSKKIDCYEYVFLDKYNVKFKAIKLETDFFNKNYEFIDTKIIKPLN